MKSSTQQPAALEKRAQPGRVRAVILALIVHALFFGFIVVGVSWQSSPTAPVEAELWDKLPPMAAKLPPPEPPKPEPPKPEPPKPEPPKPEPPKPEPPKPEPPKPEPPKPEPPKPEPPKPDPEIALKAEREEREREKRKQDEARKKREQEEEAKRKREQEEAAKRKREQEEARKKREDEQRRREEEKARAAAEDARQKQFNEFVNRIRAKIRGRANVPDTVTGRPNVQIQIRILPGGDVLDIRVIKSSGNRTYDTAIERAIRSAQPLPVPPADSELFPQFRDLILNFEHER